jgi:putative ABC transport system substrate-binding protein
MPPVRRTGTRPGVTGSCRRRRWWQLEIDKEPERDMMRLPVSWSALGPGRAEHLQRDCAVEPVAESNRTWIRHLALPGLAVVLFAAPFLAGAQPSGKVYQIGLLGTQEGPNTDAFRQGLRALGYEDGRNIAITYRWSEGKPDRLPALAAELVSLKLDLIVASGPQQALAARAATTMIPIVFTLVADPIGLGLVPSLARPGANLTGVATLASEGFAGKQLELLKEAIPKATRLAVLLNPANPNSRRGLPTTLAAAEQLRVKIQLLEVSAPDQLDSAFEAAARERADGMHVYGDGMLFLNRARIVALAAKNRIPVMYPVKETVRAGGLMSYGPDISDALRRTAGYVDKILKGAKPVDLPVEQPTKFDLVINMKTARVLGLAIPSSLLLRADEIIE